MFYFPYTLTFLAFFVFLFGLIIGSFLNCTIWRLYKNETLGGRSYCPNCRNKIVWYDNIPLFSFWNLGGRCRHCRENISYQYPLVEFITAILFLLVFLHDVSNVNYPWILIRDWILISILIIVFVYDLRWQLIPVFVLKICGIIIFVLNLVLGYSFWTQLLGASLLGGFFLLQYLATKKKGIGEGDIWLGLFLGSAFADIKQLVLIVLITYAIGSITGLSLVAFKDKGFKTKIALGPFLAIGAIITLIWGKPIVGWYFGLF